MFGKLKEIIGLGEYDEEFDELEETEEEQSEIEPIRYCPHICSNCHIRFIIIKKSRAKQGLGWTVERNSSPIRYAYIQSYGMDRNSKRKLSWWWYD